MAETTTRAHIKAEVVHLVGTNGAMSGDGQDELLMICGANSWLAKTQFLSFSPGAMEWKGHRYLLSILLAKGAALETIMGFCEQSPFRTTKIFCFCGLLAANLDHVVASGTIPYLAAKYPNDASKRTPEFPMHCLIKSGNQPILNYTALHNSYPEGISREAVELAVNRGLDGPVAEFIAHRAPRASYALTVNTTSGSASIGIAVIRALEKFPHYCTYLNIESFHWDMDSWTLFTRILGNKFRPFLICSTHERILKYLLCVQAFYNPQFFLLYGSTLYSSYHQQGFWSSSPILLAAPHFEFPDIDLSKLTPSGATCVNIL